MKILVVEDDPGIVDVLEYALRAEGHEVLSLQRGREAMEHAQGRDCVILDVGLPDMDGFEVCRQLRKISDIPILFLTSRSDEIDRVVGLEIGGDDYLVKPFSTRELVARLKAIQRRTTTRREPPADNGLVVDAERRTVTRQGRRVELSKMEFDLLHLLLEKTGRVYTREQILDSAWPDGGLVTDRTVDAHIKSLRRKLGLPDIIETVRGVGYRIRESPE